MQELSTETQRIRVKCEHASLVREHSDKILSLFNVRLHEFPPDNSPYVYFGLESETKTPLDYSVVKNVQGYADSVGWGGGGEDSSYDSEGEGGGGGEHPEVCRTWSDTLAAEYADYVDTGYTQRLEFALKLGYTEAHVQAALHKLGPNPANNELLAELIKLGAQTQPLGSEGTCDFDESRLRPIVIDGSNVAMSHGNKEVFSCRGIKICVDWFKARGHTEITVFVPKWRKEASRPNNPITGQEVLYELERERVLVWTPSRLVSGKRLVCYDDRYVLRLAAETGGIVVSNDNYRDLALESPEFKRVVEQRILMYSFVNDRFMPPDDPLGRAGPTLDKFLRFAWRKAEPACPYGRKCTYGSKCKFHHPERGAAPLKTVTERLVEHAQRHLQARSNTFDQPPHNRKLLKGKSISLPLSCETGESRSSGTVKKTPLARTRSHAVSSTVDLGEGPPPPPPVVEATNNLHKKLQRQLSLNPYEGVPATRGRGRIHQGVGRVASAPAPVQHQPPLPPAQHQPAPHHARLMIHYHLASLFPEQQVLAAMSMHPHETNPQKICAAILALFPPKP